MRLISVYIFLGVIMTFTEGTFDLYIDSEDFQKLIGVKSQLWYVRNGNVKENALQFVVPVPADVNVLVFHWQAKHNILLPYKLHYFVGNPEAVDVSLNVSNTGTVPTTLQTFLLTVNCTGKLTTEADISLTLQLPLRASLQHLTNITIHRRKICFKVIGDGEDVQLSVTSSRGASTAVYITVGCLAVFLCVVASLAAYSHNTHAKKRRPQSHSLASGEGSSQLHTSITTPCLPNSSSNTVHCQPAPLQPAGALVLPVNRAPSYHSSCRGSHSGSHRTRGSAVALPAAPHETVHLTAPQSQLESYPITYTDSRTTEDISGRLSHVLAGSNAFLDLHECVSEGTFSRLYRGLYRPREDQNPTQVMVKTVTEESSEGQRELLLREALMLVGVEHSNIQQVLAVITPQMAPPQVLYHTTHHGNMKKFLQNCGPLVTREVVTMGLQVLQALSHLHTNKLLHCDVATRNCVVDSSLHIMLGDCALSRDLFPGDYHCLGDNNNRPIKWLAIEALQSNSFSPESDVWSWGVLLWEIMTLGQQPYAEIDPFEMDSILRQGVRLAQPINCPDEMFQAMTFCWTTSPLERPSVADLIMYLTNFLQHLDKFV